MIPVTGDVCPSDRRTNDPQPNRAGALAEPALEAWAETYATLHLWTQIVGKIRLAQTPWINHSWHVTLYVTSRGLTTSPIPYGTRTFEIDFDFLAPRAAHRDQRGGGGAFALEPQSVADFYRDLMAGSASSGSTSASAPCRTRSPTPIPFDQDRRARAPTSRSTRRDSGASLVQADRVFKEFRARFIGKCSPVHFFWGGLDLAVTRFSGRRAPPHPGGVPNLPDWVAREAYSHEVSSCGFWPGGDAMP